MHERGPGYVEAASDLLNERLVLAVPDAARVVLQVGSAHGWLATALKARHPARVVYGAHSPGAPGVVPTRSPGSVTRSPSWTDTAGWCRHRGRSARRCRTCSTTAWSPSSSGGSSN